MLTLSQRNIFLSKTLINQLKVKPVLKELLMFKKILIKLCFIIGKVNININWCFHWCTQRFWGIPVHVITLYLSETERPRYGWDPCRKTFQNLKYLNNNYYCWNRKSFKYEISPFIRKNKNEYAQNYWDLAVCNIKFIWKLTHVSHLLWISILHGRINFSIRYND